jgi:NADPH-dependent glutamate synthase beta subunit-like oxidoreductase
MVVKEGSEIEIECDLIVAAIGQQGDLVGLENLDNGSGLIDADGFYRVKDHADLFVGGDIVKPHLLTTAIGHSAMPRSRQRELTGS